MILAYVNNTYSYNERSYNHPTAVPIVLDVRRETKHILHVIVKASDS